ncbi:MAG: hypothetical protein GXP14_07350 [Gammaproteobacteria bacterium]|nr:hypothetical protein [Gammaproteobacteria bacterium]
MTLFKHIIDGLNENAAMNNLDHWFDGFDSAEEAIALYGDSFSGETTEDEMKATVHALGVMFVYDVDDIEHNTAQNVIRTWNKRVWGQDFVNNGLSVPFSG